MGITSLGKMLIVLGLVFTGLGLILTFADRIPLIGRLPGDLVIRRENSTIYLPVTTCIVISLLISAILWFVRYLRS